MFKIVSFALSLSLAFSPISFAQDRTQDVGSLAVNEARMDIAAIKQKLIAIDSILAQTQNELFKNLGLGGPADTSRADHRASQGPAGEGGLRGAIGDDLVDHG